MRNRRAFTLIELLIVVAIIGILAAIAIPNFLNAQVRAKVAESKAEMRSLETAIEMYFVDHGAYLPGSDGVLLAPYSVYNVRLHGLTTPVEYLSELPKDPFNTGYNHTVEFSAPEPGVTTYDYNTRPWLINIWTNVGLTPGEANERWREYYGTSQWKMVGIGPNGSFQEDDWGRDKYDPSNGTTSDGDIVLSQAYRFGE